MTIRKKRLGGFHTPVPMLVLVAHDLKEKVFGLANLGNVHHSRLIVRTRYWKLGNVGDVIWGRIVDRHCRSLLFMLTNRDVSFLFLPRKKKTPAALGERMVTLELLAPSARPMSKRRAHMDARKAGASVLRPGENRPPDGTIDLAILMPRKERNSTEIRSLAGGTERSGAARETPV
jgi:hypothetical protein